MRELEFLPEWYPRLRRHKRLVILQGWMTLTIALTLVLWMGLARRNLADSVATMSSLERQLDQTRTEKRQLDDQLAMQDELRVQERIISALGYPIEMSRLLRTLDEVMPREMSLIDIACTTEEQVLAATNASAARADSSKDQPVERRLKIKLVGVAPTDMDLANFLAGLNSHKFLEQIALVRADGRMDGGHIMREFEVTFTINLNTPVGP